MSLVGRLVNRNLKALVFLAGSGAVSALIYWAALVRPCNLVALQERTSYDLAAAGAAAPYVRLVAAFAALGLLYVLAWRNVRRVHGLAAWALVAVGAAVPATLLLLMYPIGAADVFADIMYGRILSLHGGNPFFDVGAAYPGDRFLPYMAWSTTPAHYGPLCLLLFGLVARLAGDGVVANVVAFKLLNVLFLAGSATLVAATLRRAAPEWALAGTLALVWNPIVLYETVGNGHNDIIMAFWVLLAIWCSAQRRHTPALLALTAGALVKIVPALLMPAAALVALRDLGPWRARLRFALGTGAACLGLAAAAYLPLWRGPASLTFFQRGAMFTTSLPAALWAALGATERAGQLLGLAAWAAAGLFALWRAGRAMRDATWLAFPHAAYDILLFYLLCACPWLKEWYTIWPLAVAAVIPSGQALIPAVLLNYAGLAQPLIFWPLWYRAAPLPDAVRELRLGPAVMALPWGYVVARALLRWRQHAAGRSAAP